MESKVVYIQSAGRDADFHDGERHLLIFWDVSKRDLPGFEVARIVHLTVGAHGVWELTIEAKRRYAEDWDGNEIWPLGRFTRAQRDRLLTHAREAVFDPRSRVNPCRTWMRDLLKLMVNDEIDKTLTRAQFDALDVSIPLRRRKSGRN